MNRVLITGGGKGIGLAVTKLFVSAKYDVIVLDKDFSNFPLELNKRVSQIVFDLQKVDEIPELAKKIGDIDILINNAGIMTLLPFDKYSSDKQQAIMKINLEAPVKLITEFSKNMIKKRKGRIVNLASIAGETGHRDIWYGITKAGIINCTKSFAKILGQNGIVINCVAPAPVDTDMFRQHPKFRREAILKSTVTGRPAHPQEVAETVYWLATDSSEYINGICVDINNTIFLR